MDFVEDLNYKSEGKHCVVYKNGNHISYQGFY